MTDAEKLEYWKTGTGIIEQLLVQAKTEAASENWYSHAPIGMSPDSARGYLSARVDAYNHALEMMGWSPEL